MRSCLVAKITSPRIVAQLRLALLGDCGCEQTLGALADDAQLQRLTGAEIDIAIAGRSFEARADAALGYACAIKSGGADAIGVAHSRALRLGLSSTELDAVRVAAEHILAEGSL